MVNNTLLQILQKNCEKTVKNNEHDLSILKDKAIYVAGGTGFVGTWFATLIQYLNQTLNLNVRLYLLARKVDYNNSSLAHLFDDNNIIFIENDIRRIYEIPADVNYVLHAACTPNSDIHAIDPLDTISIIADGTKNLLEISNRSSELEKFVYLSSASIYGPQAQDAENITEDSESTPSSLNVLQSAYTAAKRFAEVLCTIFRSQYRMPIVIARPFSFIGPFQALESPWAINNFIYDALFGDTIKVLGNGDTLRSYLYGSDVAYWLLVMLIYGESGDIYNIGNDSEINVKSLAEKIVDFSDADKDIVLSNNPNTQLPSSRLVPSLKKVKEVLNLKVNINLDEAIKDTISCVREL